MTTTEIRPETATESGDPVPTDAAGWIARAGEVRAVLARDAAARERAGATPHAEVALLKASGLVTLLGPIEHGAGPGLDRRLPGDPRGRGRRRLDRAAARLPPAVVLGRAPGRHPRADRGGRGAGDPRTLVLRRRGQPRDDDLTIRDEGDELVYDGRKSFSTGSRVSDVTVLEGVIENTDTHVFAIVPSAQEGIVYGDDWDNIGLRLSESGSVTVSGVRVPWASAAGFTDKVFAPRVYNTFNVPVIQLVFVAFYLGIARGALEAGAEYTRTRTRPWLYGGHERAVDEPYQLDLYGDYTAKLWAVEALADAVAAEQQRLHDDADAVTAEQRGEHEVRVAAVKARATEVALEITGGIFEGLGARATRTELGFDRFWRDVRTHTLHDPVAYKRREVGAWVLRDELPEPTWYT